MFTERELSPGVATVREEHGALVLDAERDFETLPPAAAEDLGLLVDDLDPFSAPDAWLPPDAPEVLREYASDAFTVGMPGDGSVAWTRQTDPPVVVCKPRVDESPEAFRDFLVAEAIVQAGLGDPEHFLGFFGERYPEFDAALDTLGPVETYQVAAACYDAYLGLATRDVFAGWNDGATAPLFEAWVDAGDRLTGRLEGLPGAVGRGETGFADAAELACSGIKHALAVPAPFDALDADVYREHGAAYAVRWAEKTAETVE
ncbi:MAG: hypothetical protein V5A13_00445 [Haloarculaceae archaeon]